MRFFFKIVKILILFLLLAFVGAGFYAGNTAYETMLTAPWEKILGVTKQTADLSRIHRREQKDGWQPVEIRSADGTKLRGTYIENSRSSDRTVILLHGLYQNRSMCIPYVDMYRDMGYNVLLIDQRGHGESGGSHTTWGLRETDDLDAWTEWLRGKDGGVKIGMHGISLGAAMALIYSGTERGKNISFYVADSAYGGMMELGKDQDLRLYRRSPVFVGDGSRGAFFPKRPVAEERKDTVRHRSAGGGQTYDSACPFSPRRRGHTHSAEDGRGTTAGIRKQQKGTFYF